MVQQGVDVSHAGPVPTGNTGQHLGEAAGMLLPTVEAMVPQQLLVCPLQPGERQAETGRQTGSLSQQVQIPLINVSVTNHH